MRARIGGYLVLILRVARAMATWVHASARRWGETWTRSIKIPLFLAVSGGMGILPKGVLAWAGKGNWVWSLVLFSPIFFLHIHKQKKNKKLPISKYVLACLLHEASGLPYVKERLISVGQNHLARMHANPLIEHTMNSAKTNIAWDKYKTPISILKPPD